MSISIVDNISSCDELYYHQCTYKRGRYPKSAPFPVRICKSDEAIGLAVHQKWDSEKKALVQYLSYGDQNELSLVWKSQLTRGIVPHTNTWCPEPLQQYLDEYLEKHKKKDPLTVLLEKLYLEKIAQRVCEKEATKPDEEEVASDDDDDNHDGPLVPDTLQDNQPQPVIASADGAPDKGEKLRAGDVIEYTNTIMVTGDPRGRRVASILEVRPKQEYRLVLDNGEFLPPDTLIRRIYRLYHNKLLAYNGMWRVIQDHKLQGSSVSVSIAEGVMREAKKMDELIKANHERLLDNLEEAGIPARGIPETGTNAPASDNARDKEKSINKEAKGVQNTSTATSDNANVKETSIDKEANETPVSDQVTEQGKDIHETVQSTNAATSDKEVNEASVSAPVTKPASTDAARKRQGTKRKSTTEDQKLPPTKRATNISRSNSDIGASIDDHEKRSSPIQRLEEQLSKFKHTRLNVGRRRAMTYICHKTMTEDQLKLAIKVWQKINGSVQDAAAFLEEQVNVCALRIEKFLTGDPNKVVYSKQHKETELALSEWLEKNRRESITQMIGDDVYLI